VTEAPGPLRSDAARNRARLLEVAREHQRSEGGIPPLTVLAREAGVGVGTVYRHFPTTGSVLAALGEDGMRAVLAATRAAARHEDPAQGLCEVIGFVVRGQCVDAGIAAMLEPDEGCSPQPLVAELGGLVDTLLGRARAAGAVRPDLDGDDVRRLVVGVAHALRLPPAKDVADDTVERYVRVLVDGLRAG
jgi:AcrR family transcriptional regulator